MSIHLKMISLFVLIAFTSLIAYVPPAHAFSFSPVEKFEGTNQLIADSNNTRLKIFADGMAACAGNAACQVGLAMGFAGNLGVQQFLRPETVKDYLAALFPWFNLGLSTYATLQGSGGTSTGFVLNKSSGNTFINVANKSTAAYGSTLSASLDYKNSPTTISQSGQTGAATAQGTSTPTVVDQPAPVIVESMVSTTPEK